MDMLFYRRKAGFLIQADIVLIHNRIKFKYIYLLTIYNCFFNPAVTAAQAF